MKKLAIFDLDGTLLYTLEDLHASTNFALESEGLAGAQPRRGSALCRKRHTEAH